MRLSIVLLLALSTSVVAQQPTFETTHVADGVYRFRYNFHNTFFVDTNEGVVAFDPISVQAARDYANEIKRVLPGKTLRAIVYSHHHADHATGANELQKQFNTTVPIIGHALTREPLLQQNSPDLPPPDQTFTDNMTLHFGDRSIALHYLGRNHSDNSIVAVVTDAKIAFAVDFVSHHRIGYQDLGSFYLPDLYDSLERLQDLPFDRIVFGHGDMGDKSSVTKQLEYYEKLRDRVQKAIDDGLTEDQAAESIKMPEYSDWGSYNDWFAMNVRGIYRWLSEG